MKQKWLEFLGTKDQWNNLLSNDAEQKFRQLYEWGEFNEQNRKWKIVRLIKTNGKSVSLKCQILVKQYFFFYIYLYS